MFQLKHLGMRSERFAEDDKIYIDDEKDIYPVPLMSSAPSRKVEGYEKLLFAIWYLKCGRVKQILIDSQKADNQDCNIFDKDYYGNNIISSICSSNHCSNIDYYNNRSLYEEMFFTVLTNLTKESLDKLFTDVTTTLKYGVTQIVNIFKELSDRPHMLIALWDFGLKYTEADLEVIKNVSLKNMLKEHSTNEFLNRRSTLLNNKCPITQQIINTPAILTDGTVYEYEFIKQHLLLKDTNPLTNEILFVESGSQMYKASDGKWHGVPVSAKKLYLPNKNTFEHFNLINKVSSI
jgi:hypothetical protein